MTRQSDGTNSAPTSRWPLEIFGAFLQIGATSIGGGLVAHIRSSVVVKRRWVDDATFVEVLTISQALPGLNSANMALLIGDRLSGASGALAALAGICLPGAVLMYFVGLMYNVERQRPLVVAALEGIAPAAAGLLLATTLKLGQRSFSRVDDVLFIVLT